MKWMLWWIDLILRLLRRSLKLKKKWWKWKEFSNVWTNLPNNQVLIMIIYYVRTVTVIRRQFLFWFVLFFSIPRNMRLFYNKQFRISYQLNQLNCFSSHFRCATIATESLTTWLNYVLLPPIIDLLELTEETSNRIVN